MIFSGGKATPGYGRMNFSLFITSIDVGTKHILVCQCVKPGGNLSKGGICDTLFAALILEKHFLPQVSLIRRKFVSSAFYRLFDINNNRD